MAPPDPFRKGLIRQIFEGWLSLLRGLPYAEILCLVGTGIADAYIWLAASKMQTISGAWGGYLILLATMFGVSFLFFVRSMQKDDRLAVESNWGGLGGGLGGWRVSSSLVFLLTSAALFAALLFGVQAGTRPDLRERYRAAINLGEHEKMRFDRIEVAGGRLNLTGSAPSACAYDKFWDQVKLANSTYDDIVVAVKVPSGTCESGSSQSAALPAPGRNAGPVGQAK
jgi:hypothetical protein